jgi:hypothetical protein
MSCSGCAGHGDHTDPRATAAQTPGPVYSDFYLKVTCLVCLFLADARSFGRHHDVSMTNMKHDWFDLRQAQPCLSRRAETTASYLSNPTQLTTNLHEALASTEGGDGLCTGTSRH